MNKTLLKNFAIDARKRLLQMVQDQAALVGVTKNAIEAPVSKSGDYEIYSTPAGTENTITGREIKQRENLVKKVKTAGFDNVMEQAAYTWFNRIIAIRYMEVNDYLPTHIRVLSSATEGKKEPDIVTEAPNGIDLNFAEAEKQKITELKAKADKADELFALLFIKQCNELNKILPKLFESTNTTELDFTELLFGLSYTRTDGLLSRLLEIDEADFKDQVQIIGWMYQYYNTELKDDTFAKLKKNVKISKERIPAATQLFTPDWIVRYMVENSLGRLYAQSQKAMDEKTVADMMGWKYYLPQAEQTEEVQKQLDEMNSDFVLEKTKVLDPCMGSGHILVYAFDVLMRMYQNAGYNERDAAKCILENNIYGLDIDDRAAQLAYFALMMKGRQYDRRFFDRGISPKVYAIQESNGIDRELLKRNLTTDQMAGIDFLITTFNDAKEYGSILDVRSIGYDDIIEGLEEWKKTKENTFDAAVIEECIDDELMPLIEQAKVMSDKYDVVVTNPPYMGSSGMNKKLLGRIKERYEDSYSDMSTVLMEKSFDYCKTNGYMTMINIPSWMFISSYEKLRRKFLHNETIFNMLYFGRGVFGSDFGSTGFVFSKGYIKGFQAKYRQLFKTQGTIDSIEEKEEMFFSETKLFIRKQDDYLKIPGNTIAFWITDKKLELFNQELLEKKSPPRTGMMTTDNNRFLRNWFEIFFDKVGLSLDSIDASIRSEKKWFPYNKGGDFRRWYGNRDYFVNWKNGGEDIYKNGMTSFRGKDFYFKEGITWSIFGFNNFAARYSPIGSIFDIGGTSTFPPKKLNEYILGLLNSKIAYEFITLVNPTVNIQNGDIKRIPLVESEEHLESVNNLVKQNIAYSKKDWDSFETSWDFTKHPLLPLSIDYKEAADNSILISDCYAKWEDECSERFRKLKANEEELNRIFIEIYGLQDELTPEVLDKDVTVRLSDKSRDIKSFISYAVGCMLGRYSLSKEGLAYAGGDLNMNDYRYFIPDADNVIPVTDEAYFKDDIVTRFVEFVRQVYGESTLDKNLEFIAEALGNKGETPKDVIRAYFLNDFYKDHCKIYQKRPIYWMFDSGKENGFKALIYMHRYDNQTLARVRTDYLHKLQTMYEAALVQCKQIIENPVSSAHDKSNNIKRQAKITKQLAETRIYDQALGHVASQYIDIELDDGVNVNYEKFQGVEVAREGQKALKVDLLGKRG